MTLAPDMAGAPETLAFDRVPPPFGRDADGRLLIAGTPAETHATAAGDTPLFLYDGAAIRARVAHFRSAMPDGLRLHYAVKANPMPELLAAMAGLVDGFDIASDGELALALSAGMGAADISFAGPGKRDRELAAAMAAGITIHLESEGEARRLARLAAAAGTTARYAIRVNPPFELKGSGMRMGGGARPFGIDAETVPALLAWLAREPRLQFHGFHIFAGSQNLDARALLQAEAQTITLAAELARHAPAPVRLLNLGGGFGVPYFPADRPLDLGMLGEGLADLLASRPPELEDTGFALELGRWLVAEAGVYLTRILDVKQSGGETFVVTDGGLHHQLAASGNFGTVIRRNYPLVNASRDTPPDARTRAQVVGCLCTPLDRLGENVALADPEPGDLVAVFMAGAYGRTASPERFLGHPPPLERYLA